jgi:hypothetical protein
VRYHWMKANFLVAVAIAMAGWLWLMVWIVWQLI